MRSRSQVLPVDSDVDLRVEPHRTELRRTPWAVMLAISAGGGLGGLARFGIGEVLPAVSGGFPWATFGVNVSGCLLIGGLMVLVTEVWTGRRLARPFLGVGLLGGFTTFSFHVVEAQGLIEAQAAGTALGYLAATAVATLAAVYAGMVVTRWAVRPRIPREGDEARRKP